MTVWFYRVQICLTYLHQMQGMGKTVQLIGLMLLHRNPAKPTLICCPKTVVTQWTLELTNKVSEAYRFKVGVYGEEKLRDAKHMSGLEIVITTYAAVRSALDRSLEEPKPPKKKRTGKDKGKGKDGEVDGEYPLELTGPFENTEWGRIILDECQAIKNIKSRTAIAISRLRADF